MIKNFIVWTGYKVNDKWYSASDHVRVESLEAAHVKGVELIKEQRKELDSGIVRLPSSDVPRRYVVAEIVHTTEEM